MRVVLPRAGLIGALMLLACPSPRAWAGAWVLPARRAWGQISVLHQDTTERYFLDGERTPYFFDGRNRTTGVFLDLRYGVTDRLEVVAQLPVYRLQFDDLSDRRNSTGLGDLRLAARWNLRKGSTVATLGAAGKFPTGEFVNDAEVVPVGGPIRHRPNGGSGTLVLATAYLSVLAGYRLRGANRSNGIRPGDEFFWSAEAGHRVVSRLGVKGVARGLHGQRSTSFGLEIQTLKREVIYLQPGLVWELAPDRGLELSLPFTVKGRNWPAGVTVGLGFYTRF